MKKITLMMTALVVFAASLSACNTTQGFGKDIQKAGQGISNAAERAKHG